VPGPPVETQPGIALAHEEFASYFHGSAVKRASAASGSASGAVRDSALTESGFEGARSGRPRRSPARRGREAAMPSSPAELRDLRYCSRARENLWH